MTKDVRATLEDRMLTVTRMPDRFQVESLSLAPALACNRLL